MKQRRHFYPLGTFTPALSQTTIWQHCDRGNHASFYIALCVVSQYFPDDALPLISTGIMQSKYRQGYTIWTNILWDFYFHFLHALFQDLE